MALPSRHRIWNSSPGGLRLSTLALGHGGSPQFWIEWAGKKLLFLRKLNTRRSTIPVNTKHLYNIYTTLYKCCTNVSCCAVVYHGSLIRVLQVCPDGWTCQIGIRRHIYSRDMGPRKQNMWQTLKELCSLSVIKWGFRDVIAMRCGVLLSLEKMLYQLYHTKNGATNAAILLPRDRAPRALQNGLEMLRQNDGDG